MLITLAPGEKLYIELAEAYGRITVEFGEREFSIHADMPDSDKREGKIYSERFAEDMEKQLTGMLKEETPLDAMKLGEEGIIDHSNSAEQIAKDFGKDA